MSKPIVIIESPFAGDTAKNIAYARACVQDSLGRGEAPYASHLLYTQPGVLDDDKPEERRLGMEAGWEFMRAASRVAFYTDLGMSSGMQAALRRAEALGVHTETRTGISSWDVHDLPFPEPAEPPETPASVIERIVRGIRVRWSARTPVIAREAILALADQIEKDEL